MGYSANCLKNMSEKISQIAFGTMPVYRASPVYILQESMDQTLWNVEFTSSSLPLKEIPKEYHVHGQIEHSECALTAGCDALSL